MTQFINDRDKWLLFPCAGWPRRTSHGVEGYCSVPIGQQRDGKGNTWTWDGNIERPTLSPSIDCGDCKWHGHIQNGEYNPPRQMEPQS